MSVVDYRAGERRDLAAGTATPTGLPGADAIEFALENGATVMVRPSGTEPKMKLYLAAKERSREASAALLERISAELRGKMGL